MNFDEIDDLTSIDPLSSTSSTPEIDTSGDAFKNIYNGILTKFAKNTTEDDTSANIFKNVHKGILTEIAKRNFLQNNESKHKPIYTDDGRRTSSPTSSKHDRVIMYNEETYQDILNSLGESSISETDEEDDIIGELEDIDEMYDILKESIVNIQELKNNFKLIKDQIALMKITIEKTIVICDTILDVLSDVVTINNYAPITSELYTINFSNLEHFINKADTLTINIVNESLKSIFDEFLMKYTRSYLEINEQLQILTNLQINLQINLSTDSKNQMEIKMILLSIRKKLDIDLEDNLEID